jgi:acetyl/propionyl-CoA carboxylase alpha subunit
MIDHPPVDLTPMFGDAWEKLIVGAADKGLIGPAIVSRISARDREIAHFTVEDGNSDRRLKRALEEFVVEGMKTTVPLHQRIIRDEAFLSGDYTIKWLERWLEENKEMVPAE